jgi:hypothetical protein
MEVWKPVKDFEGYYEVSNLGRVKSLKRIVKNGKNDVNIKEKILKQTLNINKYLYVSLNKNGIKKNFKVHQIIAISFFNHKLNGKNNIVVDHINNIKTDNCINNLQLITNRENCSKEKRGISFFTGVSFAKRENKWRSYICIENKFIHLGYFKTEIEASIAYKNKLNFIKNINNEPISN